MKANEYPLVSVVYIMELLVSKCMTSSHRDTQQYMPWVSNTHVTLRSVDTIQISPASVQGYTDESALYCFQLLLVRKQKALMCVSVVVLELATTAVVHQALLVGVMHCMILHKCTFWSRLRHWFMSTHLNSIVNIHVPTDILTWCYIVGYSIYYNSAPEFTSFIL